LVAGNMLRGPMSGSFSILQSWRVEFRHYR